MDELRPTLDDWVQRHDDFCTCEMLFDWSPKLCDCGQVGRVEELTKLRAEQDAARKVIEPFATMQCETKSKRPELRAAAAWLKAHPE